MTESAKTILNIIGKLLFFFFCVPLVIYGQRTIGYHFLFIELLGLAGVLLQLWNYNRKFK